MKILKFIIDFLTNRQRTICFTVGVFFNFCVFFAFDFNCLLKNPPLQYYFREPPLQTLRAPRGSRTTGWESLV